MVSFLGQTSREPVGGFVASNLHPSNLNGWDTGIGRESGRIASLDSDHDLQGVPGPRRRKQNKCLGSSKADPNFILGEDLTMSGVAAMADKTIVRKSYGPQFSEKTLRAWAESNWGAPSNPTPRIFRLSRGWFMIIFSEPIQALVVLQKSWSIDSSLVLMKLWNPTFDATSERLDSIPIWVRLPGLPPHLWSEK
jgi:hypothetical protein